MDTPGTMEMLRWPCQLSSEQMPSLQSGWEDVHALCMLRSWGPCAGLGDKGESILWQSFGTISRHSSLPLQGGEERGEHFLHFPWVFTINSRLQLKPGH